MDSDPALLRSFGFDRVHVADPGDDPLALAIAAAREVLDDSGSVDLLILATGIPGQPPDAGPEPPKDDLLQRFRFPVARLQHELDLRSTPALSVNQQGCASMLSAIRLGDASIAAGDASRVLCVGVDVVPEGVGREVIYNVLSDAACAVLLDATRPPLVRTRSFRQVTKGYYWDSPARREELIAAFLPTARAVMLGALADAGLAMDDIALIVPDNVSRRSWELLLELIGVDPARAFLDNIPRRGHSVGCDTIANLDDVLTAGLASGDNLLVSTFGFGATWTAAVLQVA